MFKYGSVLLLRSLKTLGNRGYASIIDFARPIILGIESSCDDTGAAILDRNGAIIGESLHSQQNHHLRYRKRLLPCS